MQENKPIINILKRHFECAEKLPVPSTSKPTYQPQQYAVLGLLNMFHTSKNNIAKARDGIVSEMKDISDLPEVDRDMALYDDLEERSQYYNLVFKNHEKTISELKTLYTAMTGKSWEPLAPVAKTKKPMTRYSERVDYSKVNIS
tara:strand:- start:355 stop:786 length:432 start_codon:yes stop_codon:yes gene_type:complete